MSEKTEMAVAAYKRVESDCIILNNVTFLFNKIMNLVKTNDILGKKNARLLGQTMVENIREVLYCVSAANNLDLKSAYEWERRKKLQYDAFDMLSRLAVDIELSLNLSNDPANPRYVEILNDIRISKCSLKKWIHANEKTFNAHQKKKDGADKQDDSEQDENESQENLIIDESGITIEDVKETQLNAEFGAKFGLIKKISQ